jgi:hypothetical protein
MKMDRPLLGWGLSPYYFSITIVKDRIGRRMFDGQEYETIADALTAWDRKAATLPDETARKGMLHASAIYRRDIGVQV